MEGFKKNEEQLKHYVAEYKTKLKNQDQVWASQYFGSIYGIPFSREPQAS